MKLIKSSYEILDQKPGLEGIYEQIELAGRTCYASSHKIQYKENDTCNDLISITAKDFVDRMIKSGHNSMLEHGTVYLKVPMSHVQGIPAEKYVNNPYSRAIKVDDYWYVTSNMRVLVENGWLEDLKYLCEPTEYHEKRVTVRFTADIHFYKDTTRHRVFSWAIESTRYCNYMKEKFDMSVSFMKPSWIKEEDIPELEKDCELLESIYFKWINMGYQAQHAAYFLPQGTKAEVVMTGFQSDYNHFFDLRAKGTTGRPHPDVKALVEPLMNEFKERSLI